MAANQKRKKVINVRSRRPINIDKVFFGAVAVYICVVCYMGLTSEHIAGYEVEAGTLTENHTYTGFAVRPETVYYADTSGYVSYYARAGERVSGASLIYTIDERGETNELIQQNAQEADLSDEDYSAIRSEIRSYTEEYSDLNFSDVYAFQTSVESSVMDLQNQSMLESLEEAGEDAMFSRVYAGGIGILEYYMDGYEGITVDTLTEDMLDEDTYERQDLKKDIVQAGEPVYKLSTSEKWSLIVPITEEEAAEYQEEGTEYMEVEFTRDHTTAWADFSLIQVGSTTCARLDFNNSMVRFADLRYIEVEFMVDDEAGLKIPNTAIVEKDFYLIPKAFLVEEGDEQGFLREVYDENGQASAEFVNMTLYSEDEEYYYVDPRETDSVTGEEKLPIGSYLILTDSQERFQVGMTGTLQGVYNINKGYTQFRQIKILSQNEEYTLVEEGTSYGLTVYDHIVLNGETVDEDEIIY